MKTYLERCPESAKINEINDLFTFRSKKKYIGFDLAETHRNEAFELYLDVGFD